MRTRNNFSRTKGKPAHRRGSSSWKRKIPSHRKENSMFHSLNTAYHRTNVARESGESGLEICERGQRVSMFFSRILVRTPHCASVFSHRSVGFRPICVLAGLTDSNPWKDCTRTTERSRDKVFSHRSAVFILKSAALARLTPCGSFRHAP